MGFKKLTIRHKSGASRGTDKDRVLNTLKDNWDAWESALQEMDDSEKAKFVELFNNIVDGSGDALTG